MSLPAAFLSDVAQLIPQDRRFDDPLSTLAFGTDASFYRLIPQLVIRVESEDEVVTLLQLAQRDRVPVTFRAAGTSLSGQAISDSVRGLQLARRRPRRAQAPHAGVALAALLAGPGVVPARFACRATLGRRGACLGAAAAGSESTPCESCPREPVK